MTRVSEAGESQRDFFISYTAVDETWAQWIAWELEQANYTVFLQAWDFTSGSRFVHEMQRAVQMGRRTIAVLSGAYAQSRFAAPEWEEAWRADPGGDERKLLVFRVEDCERPGLLAQLVSDDLFDVSEEVARSRLLAAVRQGRRKPPVPPNFPASEAPTEPQPFPGRLVPVDPEGPRQVMGPMTPDNPFAVAFAFWYAAMKADYSALDILVTPESYGHWDLTVVDQSTSNGGIASGVTKPCYDVAYVRVISDVEDQETLHTVVDGSALVEGRTISLVLRPELGGWRVHGFGAPHEVGDLPRTWRD
ncbi:toll/interleukin-1 receptor domain-containing protein [Lentzea kentuckyensis]|uniref:toll/interleukin-1 receptor domain-containing protein n=1 Tax=Lentzea kentuckyensis TaxID=360086 RepID=UPI000A39B41C